ncbi:MarR family winged helix-turn-helix transcriptional regulator [Paractinoplanes durhamensis]|uniref:MarR family transcriptional regulator n=1 Tax=Paractinoplanes durhamensis TaxID=113563 RepID=A0ABQ3ZB50_9ACTN|nr:MarR family transcriptional regulator [Actinoplanes durhamensis]GIE07058.1 MarR family transcriptional regulator [Actinoplanes durhamensis]
MVSVNTRWLSPDEMAAWVRLAAVLELLPAALDSQLRRDAGLTHFDYYVLAMLSETPAHTLRMTALAERTTATLARLSHVVARLEGRGLIERFPCPEDRRATNARLTEAGWAKVQETAPGHVATVRETVIDALTPEQIAQLTEIGEAILHRLDPEGTRAAIYQRYDPA